MKVGVVAQWLYNRRSELVGASGTQTNPNDHRNGRIQKVVRGCNEGDWSCHETYTVIREMEIIRQRRTSSGHFKIPH